LNNIFSSPKGTGGTVTWNADGWTFVLTNGHFNQLVNELVDDAEWKSMFALDVTLHTNLVNKINYEKAQLELNNRLVEKVKQTPSILVYEFTGKDAQKHVVSFLEAYSYYNKSISCDTIYMHDSSSEIIQIQQRKEQTILEKVAKKLGKIFNEINIPINDVKHIKGSPLKFTLTLTSGSTFQFGDGGMFQE
jgi:hypothetical protein